MRTWISALLFCPLSLLVAQWVDAGEKKASSEPDITYPGNVALSVEPPKGMVFRHFPSGMRLYYSDNDPPGKSVCNLGCSGGWPPLIAPDDAKPTGHWTLVKRDDGRLQWAYKGKPLYRRFHDNPSSALGDGLYGTWHVLPYFSKE